MAFEKLGVRFTESTQSAYLGSANTDAGETDRAFVSVDIVGDPVDQVVVNLNAFTVDSAGHFPGSALIDVLDRFDPGVKRWFVAQASDRTQDGMRQIDLNGLIAQFPPSHIAGAILVIGIPPSPIPSR